MKILYFFILSVFILSCEDDNQLIQNSQVTENDLLGRWEVSYLENGNSEELNGYTFEFNPENILLITKDEFTTQGSWEILLNTTSQEIKILIPVKENPLRILHNEWNVTKVTSQKIELSEMTSDTDFLEKFHLSRL